jgi:hypothetical protein
MFSLDPSTLPDEFLFTGIRTYLLQDRCTVTEFNKILSAAAPTQFMKSLETMVLDSLLEKGVKKVSHIYSLPIRTLRLMVMMNFIACLDTIVTENKTLIRTLYKRIPTVYNKDWKSTIIELYSTRKLSIPELCQITGQSTKHIRSILKEFKKGQLRDTISYDRTTFALKEAYKKLQLEKEPRFPSSKSPNLT